MPKITDSASSKLRSIVREYGADIFSTDNKVLLCTYCGTKVNHSKKYYIEQHIKTKKHADAILLKDAAKARQITSFAVDTSKKDDYFSDLTKMLLACDIPLYKVNNPEFKFFMEKYTGKKVPAESTLRRCYVKDQHESVLQKIRTAIGEHNIYVSIDETTDKAGRFICNVIVGALHEVAQSFLLTVDIIDKVNASNIATVFDNAMNILWPGGVKRDRVLIFVTDAARYMKKCGRALKLLYTKMVHITCIAHGIHRICEKLRGQFPEVDAFISNVKKVFLKSPLRLTHFKDCQPDIPLPPKPVLTRWGTWLSAALYYAKYYSEIKNIIEDMDEDAVSISSAKQLLLDGRLPGQLAYLQTNFNFLVDPKHGIFMKLQQRGAPIGEIINVVDNVETHLKKVQGPNAEVMLQKFKDVFSSNEGFHYLKGIASVVAGSSSLPEGIEVKDVEYFNWSPMVSCEVERSFSSFKSFLRDNRMSVLPENIKLYLVPLCFYNYSK